MADVGLAMECEEYTDLTSYEWSFSLLQALNVMRLKAELCDVEIRLQGGDIIYAHKCVLVGTSPFLSSILSKAENPVINMNNFPADIVRRVMDFIYTGSASIKKSEVSEILSTATTLNVKALMDLATTFLQGEVQGVDCGSTWIQPLAKRNSLPSCSTPGKNTKAEKSQPVISEVTQKHDRRNLHKKVETKTAEVTPELDVDIKSEDEEYEEVELSPILSTKRKRKPNSRVFNEDHESYVSKTQPKPKKIVNVAELLGPELVSMITSPIKESTTPKPKFTKKASSRPKSKKKVTDKTQTQLTPKSPVVRLKRCDEDVLVATNDARKDEGSDDDDNVDNNIAEHAEAPQDSEVAPQQEIENTEAVMADASESCEQPPTADQMPADNNESMTMDNSLQPIGSVMMEPIFEETEEDHTLEEAARQAEQTEPNADTTAEDKDGTDDTNHADGTEETTETTSLVVVSAEDTDISAIIEQTIEPIQVVKKIGDDYLLETVVPSVEEYAKLRDKSLSTAADQKPVLPAGKSKARAIGKLLPGRRPLYGKPAADYDVPTNSGLTFMCELCHRCFSDQEYYERHRKWHTQLQEESSQKRFACSHCDFRSKYKVVLVEHERRHTGEKPYTCEQCGKCFAQKGSYRDHVTIHQGYNFSCPKCDRKFRHRSNVRSHMRAVHTPDVRPHVCPMCSKCFKMSSTLKKHFNTHTAERGYSCHLCKAAYYTRTQLNRHIQNKHENSGIRYRCNSCGRMYKQRSSIDTHKCQGKPSVDLSLANVVQLPELRASKDTKVAMNVAVVDCNRSEVLNQIVSEINIAKEKRRLTQEAAGHKSEGETSSESEGWMSDIADEAEDQTQPENKEIELTIDDL